MKNTIKVADHPNFVRDTASGHIKNIDRDGFLNYIANRDNRKNEKEELVDLKSQVDELKTLVNALLNKGADDGR